MRVKRGKGDRWLVGGDGETVLGQVAVEEWLPRWLEVVEGGVSCFRTSVRL